MSFLYHEQLYRSQALLTKMRQLPVTICGAGALGANMTESLARAGFATLKVIDRDRIEEHNLSTQPYQKGDIGGFKAKILANTLYRAVGVKLDAQVQNLGEKNVSKLLQKSSLVIDTFDNSVSRGVVTDWCLTHNMPCLHVGLAAAYAEVIWNKRYRVPSPTNDDVFDYPLARNLVTLAVSVACETVIQYVADGKQRSYTITLGDFAVKAF